MSAINLLKYIKIQVCNNIKQCWQKTGFLEESLTDKQALNLLYPNTQPPYDEIKYIIELSADQVKQLLDMLEEYPQLKSDKDYLWNWQTNFFRMRKRAIEILKDSRYSYSKRTSAVCRVFGLIGEKKKPKFNGRAIKFEYEQLIIDHYCPKEKKNIDKISQKDAIIFLTEKHGFNSINACNQFLKCLNIKGLPSTWETGGILK